MVNKKQKTVVAGALGECVHVAGVVNFLQLAEQAGWRTVFLGPAVPISQAIQAAEIEKADLLAVSYRLTPETGERLLAQFAESADHLRERGVQFAFGGTPPVAERAEKLGFFDAIFNGTQTYEDILAFLKGESTQTAQEIHYPQTTIDRIKWKAPYPLVRHHFGLPTMEATREGIEKIADSKVLDRSGCPGKLLPPGKAGCSADGRGGCSCAQSPRLPESIQCQPARKFSINAHLFRNR